MGSNKDKDKAAARLKAREKVKARKATERAQLLPTPEWSAEFRQAFNQLLGTLQIQVDLERMADAVTDLERSLFRERMKPAAAAREAFQGVRTLLEQQQKGIPDPNSIPFRIEEEGATKLITFTHFRVRITTAPGGRMDYALDGLEGCDMQAFEDIIRLAREANDGEYYLHGAAAYEWWLSSRGYRPPFDQLTSMARQLYRSDRFTARLKAG